MTSLLSELPFRRPNYVHEAPRLRLEDVTFTDHALERARERGFTAEQIRDAIQLPEQAWLSGRHRTWNYRRDTLTVALREPAPGGRWTVVTVLFAQEHHTTENLRQNPPFRRPGSPHAPREI
jgi:hypothetical protein